MKRFLILLAALIMLMSCALADDTATATEPPEFFPQLRLEDMEVYTNATFETYINDETGEIFQHAVYVGETEGSSPLVCYYDANGDLMHYCLRITEPLKVVYYDAYGNITFATITRSNYDTYYWFQADGCWSDDNFQPVENPPKDVNLDDLPPLFILEAPEASTDETAE